MTRPRTASATGSIARPADLSATTVDAMFDLLLRYFQGRDRESFLADLDDKNRVLLIRHGDDVVGFSTVSVTTERIFDNDVRVLFSGDTIVDRAHWGTRILERTWLQAAVDAAGGGREPLVWLLICGGYRTYRYLPIFFREFWPRFNAETPVEEQRLLEELARRRFGLKYRDGVVRLGDGRLRPGVSPIDTRRRRDPHVAFFERSNPGHETGDELACITRITRSNLTRAGLKTWQRITR